MAGELVGVRAVGGKAQLVGLVADRAGGEIGDGTAVVQGGNGPADGGVGQAEVAGGRAGGQFAEAEAGIDDGQPQVEVGGHLVVADVDAGPLLVGGVGEGLGQGGLVGRGG